MSNEDATKAAEAVVAVMSALQPLSQEERSRVLHSAAALFGVSTFTTAPAQETPSLNAHNPSATPHSHGAAGSGNSSKRLSIVELLKEKAPATNSQRIACFAYYREKVESNGTFSKSDLAGYFAKAKLADPGPNYARDYNKAVRDGWIHDNAAESYLTQNGEAAVEAGFGGKGKARGPQAGKRRKGKKPE